MALFTHFYSEIINVSEEGGYKKNLENTLIFLQIALE